MGGALAMTSRQWTREELDRVHPLSEGWAWAYSERLNWHAVAVVNVPGRMADDTVAVVSGDVLRVDSYFPQLASVALAVILASHGLDSREAMADALQAHVDEDASRLADVGPEDRTTGLVLAARANAAAAIVAMLRRGRVEP
jgi:hypothetical protein